MRLVQGLNLGQVVGGRPRVRSGVTAYTTTKPPVGARLDPAHSLNVGRVVSLLFNEGQGTTFADNALNVPHTPGILSGGNWTTDPATGYTCYQFTDVQQHADFSDANCPAGYGPMTMLFRAKPVNPVGIFAYYGKAGSGNAPIFFCPGGDQVAISSYGVTSGGVAGFVNAATMQTVVTSCQNDHYDLYLNGVFQNSSDQGTNRLLSLGQIGLANNIGSGFVGLFDTFDVWNRLLTAAEVADLAANPYRGYVS